jgi:hypothetical protein
MIKIKRINENWDTNNINKVEPIQESFKYFKLRELLAGLERERHGITRRINAFIYNENDPYFLPQNIRGLDLEGRLYSLNLYYYGLGDEYTYQDTTAKENIENSKNVFAQAFVDGPEKELRLDLNLMYSVYEDDIDDIENFLVVV